MLREGLPDLPPFRAWSNFEFIAQDGSINEVDALVISTDRVHLLEIKGWGGLIQGNQHSWTVRNQGSERVKENPLLLTNRKSEKLKSLLARQPAFKKLSMPFISTAYLPFFTGLFTRRTCGRFLRASLKTPFDL